MTKHARVLIIEDDPVLGPAIVQRFRLEGFAPRLAASGAAALADAAAHQPQAIVSDIRLPDLSGEEIYRRLLPALGSLPVYFMTAFGDIAQAVRLVKAGARDYLTKPVDIDALVESLRETVGDTDGRDGIETDDLGPSPQMRSVEATLRKAARVDVPVLLRGETGVGKEVAARLLHRASGREGMPFVAVNCAAIPSDLLESTLFGHEKGAFTGAAARQVGLAEEAGLGTLFLDEIAELPTEMQAKLLRLVQERSFRPLGASGDKPFRARLVAATHADLEERIAAKAFRQDLYYRINVIEVTLPPLRDRPEDVGWLAERFLRDAEKRFGTGCHAFASDVASAFNEHDWPGNARELRNRIERSVALAEAAELTLSDLFPEMSLDSENTVAGQTGSLDEAVRSAARKRIADALRESRGNRTEAARILNVSRTTLWKWTRELDLN